jgi:glycine/D-amino acid oxidase-like deaminating enzyme
MTWQSIFGFGNREKVSMGDSFDVAIVGNGSVALSIARELSRAATDTRIVVIGPSKRGGSASLTAGAMINVWAELEANGFDNPAVLAKFELARRAMTLWSAHAAALAEESGMTLPIRWGTYIINSARGTASEDRAFDYVVEQLHRHNQPVEVVGGYDLPFLSPTNLSRTVRAAKVPDGMIDSRLVVRALETIVARAANCTLVDETVEQLSVPPSGSKILRLSSGRELRAGTVVLANGSFAQALVDQVPDLKRSVPRLLFGGGVALDITFPSWMIRYGSVPAPLRELSCVARTMDRGGACGFHLVPLGNDTFYFGASSGVWTEPEPQPRVHAVGWLLHGLETEFSNAFFTANVTLRGPGYRPVTMDTFPLLGESELKGIWFVNGTKRDGFTCAPYLAREVVKAMARKPNELPEMFRPSRPLISYWDRERATTAAVHAAIGGEHMHGLVLPPYRLQEWADYRRRWLENIYDRRGLKTFGIHPELTHLYDSDEFFALTDHARAVA